MSTEMIAPNVETMENKLMKLTATDEAIADFKERYLGLTIKGVDDKEGLKAVYKARQDVKNTRVSLTKYADSLKQDALAWQRKVNAEEKRVVAELKAIEDYLQEEEDKIEAEKERLRREEELKETQRIQSMIQALVQYNVSVDYAVLKYITEEGFAELLENAKEEHRIAQEKKAEEERLAQIERERIEAERKELEELREKQAEQQRIIDQQREALEEQKRLEFQRRQGVLVAMGMKVNRVTDVYVFEDIVLPRTEVEQSDLEQFLQISKEMETRISKIIADRESAKKARQEEAEKQAAEKARAEAEIKRRWGVLSAMGLIWDGQSFLLNDINVYWTDVVCWTDREFTTHTTDIQAEIEKRRAEATAKREAEIQQARDEAAAKARKEEQERIERENKEKAEAEEKARKAAERKAANAPDKQKLSIYLQQHYIPSPTVKTDEAVYILTEFNNKLQLLLKEFESLVEAL
jgi:hypothetical protein